MEIVEKSYVVPNEITPSDPIWLSNLDLLVSSSYTPTIYFYKRAADSNFFSADALKSSLGRVLVQFYPLAGRIGPDQSGRPEIKCTAEGVLFVVARSESTADDIGEFEPSDELTRLYVPAADPAGSPPLVMFQVTYMKCGNVILGAAVNHTAADGMAALHFINTWADATRGIPLSTPPYLDRTLLRARSPPVISFPHSEYAPMPPSLSSPLTATAHLRLSPHQVARLKTAHRSTFKAVAAHAWRAACVARSLSSDQTTRMLITADARGRVKSLPALFAGNTIFRTQASAKAGEIVFGTIGFVMDRISEATDGIEEEFVRSLVDYVETVGDVGGLQKGKWVMPQSDVWVISWLRLPIYEADFGWGKPEFMGRSRMQFPGLVYLSNDPRNDGGIIVTAAIEPENMDAFKTVFYEKLEAE